MINFVVSFLIGFIFSNIEFKPNSKTKKSGKKLKKKKNIDTHLEKTADIKENLDPNVIECGIHKEICHVEYNLLPSKVFPEYQIDVVCWGAVTKIFTKEDVCCIKSYRHGNITWVAFSVLHKLCSVPDVILTKLLNFEVSFKFSQASNDLMLHVRNDVPKKFYNKSDEFTDDTSTGKSFKIVTQIDPRLTGSFDEMITKEEEYNVAFPNHGNVLSLLLGIPSDTHKYLIIEQINGFKSQHRPTKTETSSPNSAKEKNKTSKVESSKKKQNEKREKSKKIVTVAKNKFTLNFNGNLFFKEGKTCSSEITELQSSSISFAAVFITVTNLLSYKQKKTLNPFILNIQQLCNLQTKIVDGINHVYCEYVLNNLIIKQHTPRINLTKDKTLDFNYCHVFFLNPVTEDSSNDDLYRAFLKVEAIQTGRLIVKVYGVMSESVEDEIIPLVFGQRLTDPDISSRHQELFNRQCKPNRLQEDGIVLLGTAVVNLFPLSTGERYLEEVVTLTSIPIDNEDENLVGTSSSVLIVDKINTISLQSEDKVKKNIIEGIVPEDLLLWNNTTLQIKVTIAEPIYQLSLSHLLKLPSIYSRAIVVFKNITAAVRVIQKIRGLNSKLLSSQTGLYPLVVSDAEKKKYYEMWKSLEDEISLDFEPRKMSLASSLGLSFSGSENWRLSFTCGKRVENVVTGFFVDNFQEGLLVIEGLTNLTFPRVMAYIYNLPAAHGFVVYNSDILFSKKLYSDLSNLGGLYIITMGKPMNSLLSEACAFIQGNIPIHAQKALLQLDLLRNTSTMHSACSMQIFPTIQQLLSFDIEFGVPLRIRP